MVRYCKNACRRWCGFHDYSLCGINRAMYERFKNNKRLMNIVSRGGSIMFAWMAMTGEEIHFMNIAMKY